MLANFFGKSKPSVGIIIFILYLFFYFLSILTNNVTFDFKILVLSFVLFGFVNFINIKNELTSYNFYAFLFFVLLMSSFHEVNNTNNTYYINIVLLIFLRRVYSLQSDKNTILKIFDSGFWLGILFLIEPFTILFSFFIYAAIFLYKQINIRTILIPILGFVSPVFLYFTYCIWFGITDKFYSLFLLETDFNWNTYNPAIVFFWLIFVVSSIILKTMRLKTDFKRTWVLILINFILSMVLLLTCKEQAASKIIYMIFPSSIILANGLELISKKWFSNLLLVLFFIFVLTLNFYKIN